MVEISEDDANAKCLEGNTRKKLEFFEDILPHIGDFGKYQWTLLLSLFPFGIAFIAVFIAPLLIVAVPPKHWCKINELMDLNLTQDQRIKLAIPESNQYPFFDRCHRKNLNFRKIIAEVGNDFDSKQWDTNETIKCDEWEYDFSLIPYPSIGVEMNWVCDQEYRIATAQAVFFLGSVFGNFIFGWISDQKGRLLALKLCTVFAFVATIGTANAHHFWTFTLCRFILGFAFDNIITVPVILVLEYTTEKKRNYVTCLGFGLTLLTGKLLLTWSAYFIGDWRIFTYLCSASFVVCFLFTFIMPESIRWYASRGLSDEILKKLRRIAQVNGKSPEAWMYDELLVNLTRGNKNVESATLMDLRKTPHLAKNTALFSLVFALHGVIFDTNLYYLHRYELSIFISFTWSCIETLLAFVLFKFLVNRFGRRLIGSLLFILIMIFSFAFVLVKSEIGKMFMASIARFGLDCLNYWFLQYTPELFPTTLRTQGSASVHFFATVMHFITPYIILLSGTWKELPILLVAIVALLAAILTILLPETAGKNLRQTLREGEKFCKEKKFWPILVFQKQ